MSIRESVKKAKEAFDKYAGMDYPELPPDHASEMQVKLARWQTKNFGVGSLVDCVLGVSEEAGELAHALLKHRQRIRGMANKEAFREAAADAIADIAIYSIQVCTLLRIDYYELVFGRHGVANTVMRRDWTDGSMETEVCAKCKGELGLMHYSDIPSIGNLCLPCWSTWQGKGTFREVQQ